MGELKPQRTQSKVRGTKYLAIDIDPEGLLVVSGPVGGDAARVEHAHAWLPGEEYGPPVLSAASAKKIGEELRDRLKAAGIPPGPVLVSIGRDKVILKDVKYPAVDPDDEPALVRFQAMKEIAENPDEVVLDYTPLSNGDAEGGADRRATAVVVKRDYYNAVQSMVTAAGWKLAAVTPRPFAVAAGLAEALATGKAPALGSSGDAAAVVTLSPLGGEFTVVRHGIVTFTRAIPAPVIANETLLLGEIRRNLTTYDGQNRTVKAVYVPEAEDMLGGWSTKLQHGLPVPVYAYDPVATAAEPIPSKLRSRFAGAVGLLAGRVAGLPINFTSPRQPKVKSDPRKPLFIATAIAALVLIVGGGLTGYLMLSAADDRLQQKQQDKADLEKLLADADPDGKRIAAAEQWEARGVNYLDQMFDFSEQVPPGDTVRVSKITGSAIRVDKAGKQNGQAHIVLSVGAKNVTAAADLVTAIDRDNTKDRKYYVGTTKTVGGIDTHTNTHNQLATIETVVNHRSPGEYTRFPTFSAPRRGVIPPVAPPTPDPAPMATDMTEKKPDPMEEFP